MTYRRVLPDGILVRSTAAADAIALEELQRIVFPTLVDSQRLKAQHYLNHIEIFPEGQFIAEDKNQIIGMTTSIRLSEHFLHTPHNFDEIIQGGFCSSHEPNGEWLYGVDMGAHPTYRGRGVARALYVARQKLVETHGLLGQYTMGMLSGYGKLKDKMSAEEYYEKLLKDELVDPTVSAQMKIGFEPRGLVPNYLEDPECCNYCVRLVLEAAKFKQK